MSTVDSLSRATPNTEIYTLSLHDALPISARGPDCRVRSETPCAGRARPLPRTIARASLRRSWRSEEHTSELQSRLHLVCRLLLEKKKKKQQRNVKRLRKPTASTCKQPPAV